VGAFCRDHTTIVPCPAFHTNSHPPMLCLQLAAACIWRLAGISDVLVQVANSRSVFEGLARHLDNAKVCSAAKEAIGPIAILLKNSSRPPKVLEGAATALWSLAWHNKGECRDTINQVVGVKEQLQSLYDDKATHWDVRVAAIGCLEAVADSEYKSPPPGTEAEPHDVAEVPTLHCRVKQLMLKAKAIRSMNTA